jgi:hypothetical protein
MAHIIVATRDGLHELETGRTIAVEHAERDVTHITGGGGERWAILDASEIWRASDGEWRRVGDLGDGRATCLADAWEMLAGASEARLFRVTAEGMEAIDAFDRAEGRSTWYTPWGGPPDTRSISEWDDDVYVNVHVGGILRTDDRGASWKPTIDIDADVHQVATAEGMVLAACAGGLATSLDRGATWTFRTDGLEAPYSRAVVVCGDAVLVSASNGPRGGRAAVYRGDLRGGPFERCREGLPEAFDDNIDSYCLDAPEDGSFVAFGTSDGLVFGSEDAGGTWTELASNLPPVHRVLVLP